MAYHLVADGQVSPIAFARVQDAYVYVLLRLDSDSTATSQWALIERSPDGDEVVVPTGELPALAERWREQVRADAEQARSGRAEQLRTAS